MEKMTTRLVTASTISRSRPTGSDNAAAQTGPRHNGDSAWREFPPPTHHGHGRGHAHPARQQNRRDGQQPRVKKITREGERQDFQIDQHERQRAQQFVKEIPDDHPSPAEHKRVATVWIWGEHPIENLRPAS